jgi:myo-inositol-1(or 4)-monophosphatase
MSVYHPTLNIAVRAARRAGNLISNAMEQVDRLEVTEKATNDFVTEVDRQAEESIITILQESFPNHCILGEENGEIEAKDGSTDNQWIIDPLDGTTNFLHGFPQFAVSIALKHKGRLEHAVVYDPTRQELFTASRGGGAQLNDHRLRVTSRKNLDGALLGTGFPFKQQEHLETYLDTFKALFPMTAGIRRPGSAALDLAYVAAGRLDGFWEIGLNPWDMAGGALLVQEAGGLISDFGGGDDFLDTGNVVAGSPKVFKAMLQTIRPHLPKELSK